MSARQRRDSRARSRTRPRSRTRSILPGAILATPGHRGPGPRGGLLGISERGRHGGSGGRVARPPDRALPGSLHMAGHWFFVPGRSRARAGATGGSRSTRRPDFGPDRDTRPGAFLPLRTGAVAGGSCHVGGARTLSPVDRVEHCLARCAAGGERPGCRLAWYAAVDGFESGVRSGYHARYPDAADGRAASFLSLYVGWRIARAYTNRTQDGVLLLAPWAAVAALLYAAGVWVFLQPMQMRGMVHG